MNETRLLSKTVACRHRHTRYDFLGPPGRSSCVIRMDDCMVVSFEHSPIVADLAERTREHFAEVVLPIEIEYQGSAHDLSDDTRIRLQQAARDGGVFAPQVSLPYGGVGLDMRSRATIFETADLLAIRTACAPLRTARRRKHAMLPTSEALVARWAGGRTFGNIHDLAAGWMACGEWCFVAFALTK